MPEQQKVYKVLISSPSDVAKQRSVAKEAVHAISATYERRGIRVTAWTWEDDAVSQIGQPPQDAINNQLGPYDIYLGIMGSRFGSPTGNFGSGTEREYEEALQALELG